MILFAIALIGGIIIGGLFAFVSLGLYLIILFPVIMGLAGGLLLFQGIRWGKIRNPLVAILSGVFMAVVIYGAFHYGGYIDFQTEAKDYFVTEMGEKPADVLNAMVNGFLIRETGQSEFFGYMAWQAKEGVTISRVVSSKDSGINLGPTFSWIYWLVELVIIAWAAASRARDAARQPFCEQCDQWYGKERLLGQVENELSPIMIAAVDSGDFYKAGSMLRSPAPAPCAAVFVQTCSRCASSDPLITLKQISVNRKNQPQTSEIRKFLAGRRQLADLERGLQTDVVASPPAAVE